MVTGVPDLWRLQKSGPAATVTGDVEDIPGRPRASFSRFVPAHGPAWSADQAAAVGYAGLDG